MLKNFITYYHILIISFFCVFSCLNKSDLKAQAPQPNMCTRLTRACLASGAYVKNGIKAVPGTLVKIMAGTKNISLSAIGYMREVGNVIASNKKEIFSCMFVGLATSSGIYALTGDENAFYLVLPICNSLIDFAENRSPSHNIPDLLTQPVIVGTEEDAKLLVARTIAYSLRRTNLNIKEGEKWALLLFNLLHIIRYVAHDYSFIYYLTIYSNYYHIIPPIPHFFNNLEGIKKRNNKGKSLLLHAIDVRRYGLKKSFHERPLFARMLIYLGADVNFKEPLDGLKPIQIAVLTNQKDVAKALCTGDVNLRQKFFNRKRKYEGCIHAAESLNRFAILSILQEKRCQDLSILKKYLHANELMLLVVSYEG
jgi:hypothetical protein